MDKTLAERLRNAPEIGCLAMLIHKAVSGEELKCICDCTKCWRDTLDLLADAIDAEQAVDVSALNLLCDKLEMGGEKSRDIAMQIRAALNGVERTKTEHDGVDVDALLDVAEDIGIRYWTPVGSTLKEVWDKDLMRWHDAIRKAVGAIPRKGANASNPMPLPEGVEWPRYESGELVEFGDEIGKGDIWMEHPVDLVAFYDDGSFELWGDGNSIAYRKGEPVKRPEREVLDADGAKIVLMEFVYGLSDGKEWVVSGFDHGKKHCVRAVDHEGTKRHLRPEWLTHQAPDSMEAIGKDVNEFRKNFPPGTTMQIYDFVNRAYKVGKREGGE